LIFGEGIAGKFLALELQVPNFHMLPLPFKVNQWVIRCAKNDLAALLSEYGDV
jgi:hypothetical protein